VSTFYIYIYFAVEFAEKGMELEERRMGTAAIFLFACGIYMCALQYSLLLPFSSPYHHSGLNASQ